MTSDDIKARILGQLKQDKERAYDAWMDAALELEAIRARCAFLARMQVPEKELGGMPNRADVIRSAEWAMEHRLIKLQEATLILEWAEKKFA